MVFDPQYHVEEPSRQQVEQMPGPLVVEFGNGW